MNKLYMALLGLLTITVGCSSVSNAPTPPGISRFNTGVVSSDVLRVPIPQDGVVCYVAMEGGAMKSINCVKVSEAQKQETTIRP